MGIYNKKGRMIAKIIYAVIAIFVSIILTIFSMEAIKNVPGNSFSTDMDFIATTLLVFGLWFIAIMSCIWLVGFLVNLNKSRKNPSGGNALIIVEKKNKDLKTLSTLKKVVIGILNAACIYFIILSSIMFCVFSGFGTPIGIWLALVLANVFIVLLFLGCAISDLVTMTKLKRNPYDRKAMETREKNKKIFRILIILYICLPVVMYICILLFNR
ncbi:hypothetical protein IIY68_03705 [Candidatus Saccharibacteria bacterium]|nr:hypothetical protein [Candidatus Saccharibacteria bacterium]